ncbi:alpha-L-fucosidase [Postechiella marina]|uniref:alpha-L-fucosidase n=1 Tax=Postechiella marina TaxID=943941 RepID=A0ABP8BY60_9FLAO
MRLPIVNSIYRALVFTLCLAITLCFSCQKKANTNPIEKNIYKENWDSIKANYKTPKWFTNAKFGIFVNWGAYTVPAFEAESYPRLMYIDSTNFNYPISSKKNIPSHVFIHHKANWGNQKDFGYKDFIPLFKGEKFDAHNWIELFKKSGAKYVIPVADHHDGFAMYKSNTTRWNAYDMGPKRDILGELFRAGRNKGLIMGASSQFAFNWSVYNKKDHFDTTNPDYADLYSAKGKDLNQPVSNEFKKRWWNRTIDLIDNYQPDIFWIDYYNNSPNFENIRPKLASYYYNKGVKWGKEVVLQDKNNNSFPEKTIIYNLECDKLSTLKELQKQNNVSISKTSCSNTSNSIHKTTNKIIANLADIVSKNGSFILNVSPKSDGTIPNNQKDILLKVGNWLKINGEAIYNTTTWKIYGEGPTKINEVYYSKNNSNLFSSKDIRFTKKGNILYAIVLSWPTNGKINITSLAKNSEYLTYLSIEDINILGNSNNIKWQQTNHGLEIQKHIKSTNNHIYTIAIKLKK